MKTSSRLPKSILVVAAIAAFSHWGMVTAQPRENLPVDLPDGPAKPGFDIQRFSNAGNGIPPPSPRHITEQALACHVLTRLQHGNQFGCQHRRSDEALYGPHVGRSLGPVGNVMQMTVSEALEYDSAMQVAISDRPYTGMPGGGRYLSDDAQLMDMFISLRVGTVLR